MYQYLQRIEWLEMRNVVFRDEARAELQEYTSGLAGAAHRFELHNRQMTQEELARAEAHVQATYDEVQRKTQLATQAHIQRERIALVEEAEELLYQQRGMLIDEANRAMGDQQAQMANTQQQTMAAASNAVNSAEMQTFAYREESAAARKAETGLQAELLQVLEFQSNQQRQMDEMMQQLALSNQQNMLMRREVESMNADRGFADALSSAQSERLTRAEYDLAMAEARM